MDEEDEMTINRWKTKLAAGLVTAIALAAPSTSNAGTTQYDPCATEQGGGHEQGGPGDGGSNNGCATGPAGCVAIGLSVKVEPNVALPGGASVELSRSQANAYSYAYSSPTGGSYGFGQGYGHGDAHQVKADVPPTLGNGDIESSCDAMSFHQNQNYAYNYAYGSADTSRFTINLAGYGLPVYLNGDVLSESGSSYNATGSNSADVMNISGSVFGTPVSLSNSQPANTAIAVGPATLYLNEQFISPPSMFNPCPIFSGDALRLVVNDPTTGAKVATVTLSWVSTSTCSY